MKNRFNDFSDDKEFLNDYNTIYTSVVNEAMVIKKDSIRVSLHDINVSVHSPKIKESSAKYDEKTGKYKCSILNGLPIDFDANELSEFFCNNRKIINVTAKIFVQVNERVVGALFTGKRGI